MQTKCQAQERSGQMQPLGAQYPLSRSERPALQPPSMGDAGRKRWLELSTQTAEAWRGNFLPQRTTGAEQEGSWV